MEYIYIIHDDDELKYVGLTRDLMHRPEAHAYPMSLMWTVVPLEQVISTYKLSPDLGLEEAEGLMIALHEPTDNKRGPDLVAAHPWPPAPRELTPRRIRALATIEMLRSYKR